MIPASRFSLFSVLGLYLIVGKEIEFLCIHDVDVIIWKSNLLILGESFQLNLVIIIVENIRDELHLALLSRPASMCFLLSFALALKRNLR